jgi:putative Holliday junction resolvase
VTSTRRKAVLAIDHGTKRTGFAVVDALRIAVTPLDPFAGPGDSPGLLAAIARLLEERDVESFVLGWPVKPDGTPGPRALEVAEFAKRLAQRFPGVRVIRHDERLTTKAAEELLRDAGIRGPKARALRDSMSALVLLRDWIASGEPGAASR